jgi:hypothetical protein
MKDERRKAAGARTKWVKIGAQIAAGTIPEFSTCDFCRGMAADCASTRPWVKCRPCKFREPCFAITRTMNPYKNGEIDYAEFAARFQRDVVDAVVTIFEVTYV